MRFQHSAWLGLKRPLVSLHTFPLFIHTSLQRLPFMALKRWPVWGVSTISLWVQQKCVWMLYSIDHSCLLKCCLKPVDVRRWMNSSDMALFKCIYKSLSNCHSLSYSGINFEGSTVGLAFIGTLCSGHSVGVVQVRCSSETWRLVPCAVLLLAGCNC